MRKKKAAPEPRSRRDAGIAAALLIVAVLPYAGTLDHDFVNYDDRQYVVENRWVQQGLTAESIEWAWSTNHASNWHPLTWISHMVDHELFGLDPGGHHAVNVLLHALNAVLLFAALRLATRRSWPGALVAALFALHPLRVESVAWVSERKDVLSGLFFMLTLLAYVHYARRPSPGRYLPVMLALALGLAAKPMLVTVPAVLLLLDLWPLERWRPFRTQPKKGETPALSTGRLLLEKLPLAAVALASSAATFMVQGSGRGMGSLESLSLGARLANAAIAYVAYLWKTVWPAGLACFYPHRGLVAPETSPGRIAMAIAAAVALAAITLLVLRSLPRRGFLAVGWLWYLGMLVPVIGLVQVGSQAMADRYTYLPLIGIYLVLAWSIAEAVERRPGALRGVAAVSLVVVAALGIAGWRQTGHWKNTTALFTHALQVTRDNYLAHTMLAFELQESGDGAEARSHFERALEISPGYAKAHQGLGSLLWEGGDAAGAIRHFESAVRSWPDYAVAHYNLGLALNKQGEVDRAIRHYLEAIRIRPDYALAHNNLGNVFFNRGEPERARTHYEAVLAVDPGHSRAHNNLGLVHEARGDLARAGASFERALRIEPDFVDAQVNLCRVSAQTGPPDRAIAACRAAVEQRMNDAGLHATLGTLLDEAGRHREAVAHYRLLLEGGAGTMEMGRRLAWILAASQDAGVRDGAQAVLWAERCLGAVKTPDLPLMETLAAAYAEAGSFHQAVVWQRRAVQSAPNDSSARHRLELYAAGTPYREELP